MKVFVRERRRSDPGEKKPRFRVVGIAGGDLKIHAKRVRKCELDEIAGHTGAEIVYLTRDGKGEGKGKDQALRAETQKKAGGVTPPAFLHASVLVDDRAHVLTCERGMDVLRMPQGVNDLELFHGLGVLEEGQHGPFNDEILKVHLDELVHMDLVVKLQGVQVLGLLGIVLVHAPLVLEEDEGLGPDVLGKKKGPGIRAVRRNGPQLRRVLEKSVGRDSGGDGQVAQLAEHVELFQMVAVTDLHPAVFGEQHGEHLRVLPGNLVPEFGQDAGGHAQIDTYVVNVTGAGATAGHEQYLVLVLGLDQLVENGQERVGPPVHDGLPADLEHVHFRLHAEIVLGLGLAQERLGHQRLAQQRCVDMKPPLLVFFPDQLSHGYPSMFKSHLHRLYNGFPCRDNQNHTFHPAPDCICGNGTR
eukprot:TRINITY_DN6232_c0_g1_i2.p1 TRINITY_DN6232_c0_g1~~TRINITY_DN6232_c0_g1_i2.p1  ORF type:complete len:415 (-),score=109.24 TRINITY_DN6232_c0_g1_i2:31-1275(-)